MPQPAALIEALDFSESQVDRENHVIRGVKLSGRRSRNHHKGRARVYSDKAIEQSVSVFESCPVTVRRGHDRTQRDYDAQNGQLRGGRVEGSGDAKCSRFDWHLNSADPLTPKILEDAEKFPGNCPLSQEVLQWTEKVADSGDLVIESITTDPTKVGVAVVYRGGLNDSLFESLEDDMEIKTKEELAARYGKLCEELVECACSKGKSEIEQLQEKLAAAIADREAALAKVKELEGSLEEYKAEEQRLEHIEAINKAAKEIVGEKYEVTESLMADLLEMVEKERYKNVLTEIAKHYQPGDEEDDEEDDAPTSKSGTRYGGNKTSSRQRVGMHNRR